MKKNDLMTIATIAMTTATLTVVNFWPATLEAGGNDATPPTRIDHPKLVSHGINLTLATPHGRTFGADDEAQLELTAANPTDQAATTSVAITVSASSPADRMSRVPRLPKALWQQNLPVALAPNETKTIAIAVPAKLPPHSMIAVSLRGSAPNETATTAGPASTPPPQGIVALKVLRNPLFKINSLTNINNIPGTIAINIDTGVRGKRLEIDHHLKPPDN